jgi:penicillin-binding protein 1A
MLKVFVYSLYILLALVVGTGMGVLLVARENLPEVELLENYKPSTITRIYDVNNEVIAEFYQQRRTIIPFSKMPAHLIQALLAVEDANFYRHGGVDLKGITRAMLKNLMARRIKEGGSTITQQLSKLLFLTPERSLMRKTKEAILALRIESRYTKEEILELYLNQVYLGSGAYGVESAAQVYFGVEASQLDLPQAALIAGLLRAPSAYSPIMHPDRARRRRAHVLRRMVDEGFITKEEARAADAQPIKLAVGGRERINRAPYFVEYIRRYLEQNYEREDIYNNGLEVYTTLNLDIQRTARLTLAKGLIEVSKRRGFRLPTGEGPDDAPFRKEHRSAPGAGDILVGEVEHVSPDGLLVRIEDRLGKISPEEMKWTGLEDHASVFREGDKLLVKVLSSGDGSVDSLYSLALEQEPLVEGALIALDPRNGYIRAMVGGYHYNRSQFNRAIQARRQPGSAFKPIIYTTAIDQGYRASDIIVDAPVVYRDPWTGDIWKPANFEEKFYGPVTLRHALEHSRNAATVNLLMQLKPETVIEYARKMGISTKIDPYYSMALGSFEVSLMEMTSAYGVLANYGIRSEPMAIRYITDRDGKILEENYPRLKEVLSPQTSYIVTNMLQGVVQRGTGWRVKKLGVPVAGKTGTTNKYSDAWFIGYTPGLVTGVWVGMDDNTTIGDYETGSRAASPIWLEFMEKALKDVPPEDFRKPEGIVTLNIDARSGLRPTEKCSDDVIEEAFVEGTEPQEVCPDGSYVVTGAGSSEAQYYRR